MTSHSRPDPRAWFARTRTLLVLLAGVIACGLSFVFIRESSEPPVMLAAWRVLLSALLLTPVYLIARRRYGDASPGAVLSRSLLPGGVLAAHFVTWVMGARGTIGVNATLIVNLVPAVMPLLMYVLYTETLVRREVAATGLAIAGLAVLAIGSVELDPAYLWGDLVCVVSMLLFALYLALARRQRTLGSVWLYLVPMYAVAGVLTLAVTPLTGFALPALDAWNLANVFALAAVSTVLGHSALNFAMQRLRGQTVSVLNLLQVLVGGVAGYLLYHEIPSVWFWPACALLVVAVLAVITAEADVDKGVASEAQPGSGATARKASAQL